MTGALARHGDTCIIDNMTSTATRPPSLVDQMTVTCPVGKSGDVVIERFDISEADVRLSTVLSHGSSRSYTSPGEYTRLLIGNRLWMSDTRAERHDHVDFLIAAKNAGNGAHILVSGLGLGMVLTPLLTFGNVERVDVIENNPGVINLVGEHYRQLADAHGIELVIHLADATEGPKVVGTDGTGRVKRWDVAYHDIWPDYSSDTYNDHKAMRRKYGRSVGQQFCWMDDEVRYLYKRDVQMR